MGHVALVTKLGRKLPVISFRGRILLKLILKNFKGGVWTGSVLFRQRTSGGELL